MADQTLPSLALFFDEIRIRKGTLDFRDGISSQNHFFTGLSCLVCGLDIQNGIAETAALVADTTQVTIFGHGKLDMRTETIDLTLKPTLKKGLGIKGLGKVSLSLGELKKTRIWEVL